MAESVSPFPAQKPGCLFCFPREGGITPHFKDWEGWGRQGRVGGGNLAEVTLFESDGLRVVPDIFPVRSDGHHVLAIGKKHRTAYAQPEVLASEMHHLLHVLRDETGKPVIFAEHGGGMPHNGYEEPDTNMSIHHRHAHIVYGEHGLNPLAYMRNALQLEGWDPKTIAVPNLNPVDKLVELYNGHPYLFFNVGPEALWIEDTQGAMRSMTTQRNLSKMYGREVNWKQLVSDPASSKEATRRLMNLMGECSGTGLFTAR
ncbi:hypothetical protein COY90_02735 [Candidatus Roizmanbacteria bacterium CG_4_10_14_0_8_um_filter_39_9]|uniref:Uncharacterized protein n=1 Tax=Candidatus Roizmanbacteria bacterium CG_4_10_14_0_8_um_filter_39_9 TaxID=1974829 RepID=A0A2M7QDX7_9BACT|nr:MAG: hypothetical protein COY90_02735 [Candidatus Roizmanbacteria bacterium CG_4_10_14_0_8_um_filter_39_9]